MTLVEARVAPPLDPGFRPAALANRAYGDAVARSGAAVPLAIALERGDGSVSTFRTSVFPSDAPGATANLMYAERIVKFLLWQHGGWRVIVGGPPEIGGHVREVYSPGGARAFDHEFMGGVYEHPFTVEVTDAASVPSSQEASAPLGRHLEGCRIGFDLGASDHKVAAVKDGKVLYSEEFVWYPRDRADPSYHYNEIMTALRKAAEHLPRVDAIGGSSAGVYINNRVRVASLFRGIPRDAFDRDVSGMFLRMKEEWGGIPFEIINDGEVTALAGSMSLEDNPVLGIAMGSSEAGGYVTPEGNVTGWLNELAFAPFDYGPDAPVDEWSGERGVGAQYLCQVGVVRLAKAAGIELDESRTLPERLEDIQALMASGDERAVPIYESIGSYLGYAVAHYADFYDLKHVLVLGRVTTGEGGAILLERAREVLRVEFLDLAARIQLNLPDEKSRRVGQAIAAASLPAI